MIFALLTYIKNQQTDLILDPKIKISKKVKK